MNFTKQQTVVTYEYYNGLNLLSKIYKEKVIQSIKEIVRENGGIIDLVEDNDGYKDYTESSITIFKDNSTITGPVVNVCHIYNFDLEGFSYVFEPYDGDGEEDIESMNYEECHSNMLETILNALYNYHDELPF